MKKILNIIKKVVDIAIILLIAILAILLINNRTNKDNVTKLGDYYIFYVASGSMEPTIEIGDVIIGKIEKEYNVDDIVTYQTGKNFITHRIIEKEDNKVLTKGDANKSVDEPISEDQIRCKFNRKSKLLKAIYKTAKTPILMALLMLIVLLINILDYLLEERKEIKNETK